ncbi:ADH7 [Acrasis kona]|uniref:ADH7 n=1 Tax=Acrasis kona TaxID=1008807 RepID=A0AAW2ZSR7_9EUKA
MNSQGLKHSTPTPASIETQFIEYKYNAETKKVAMVSKPKAMRKKRTRKAIDIKVKSHQYITTAISTLRDNVQPYIPETVTWEAYKHQIDGQDVLCFTNENLEKYKYCIQQELIIEWLNLMLMDVRTKVVPGKNTRRVMDYKLGIIPEKHFKCWFDKMPGEEKDTTMSRSRVELLGGTSADICVTKKFTGENLLKIPHTCSDWWHFYHRDEHGVERYYEIVDLALKYNEVTQVLYASIIYGCYQPAIEVRDNGSLIGMYNAY